MLAQVAADFGVSTSAAGQLRSVRASLPLAAAAEWSAPERRAQVLSWTLLGQPFAWIVGMPVIGLLGAVSWRWGWVAVPHALALRSARAAAADPSS